MKKQNISQCPRNFSLVVYQGVTSCICKFLSTFFLLGEVINLTSSTQHGGPGVTSSCLYPSACLAWMTLPRAYTATSIAHQVTKACKPPHHVKVEAWGEPYSCLLAFFLSLIHYMFCICCMKLSGAQYICTVIFKLLFLETLLGF
jgi:hypothetical protein